MAEIALRLFFAFCIIAGIVILGALLIGFLACGDAANVRMCMWGF